MYAYKYTSPSVATVLSVGQSPGIYLVGNYLSDETTTENESFELRYYAIDDDGTRFPSTGYSIYSTTLATGINTINMSVTPTTVEYTKTVTINVADTFNITTTGGTAIGAIPTVESTISGGDYSVSVPTAIIYAYGPQSEIVEGENTVTMVYKDANGDTFTSDNSISIIYAETAPITEIDSQSIASAISTENYEVDVKYLYGGRALGNELGEPLTDDLGFILTNELGTIVTVTGYALLPASNIVQITGLTDDFGQTFSTTIEQCIKIPSVIYTGATTFNKETDGLSVTVVNGLTIDQGSLYEQYIDITFNFTDGLYEVYNFPASYKYPSTEYTGIISGGIDITFNEFAVIPLRLLQARINDGIDIWVDRDLTSQIGSPTITSIGDSATTNTADFYSGIFTAPTGSDYSSTNKPTVGAVKLYNGDTSGIKMAGIETMLTPYTDWTVVTIDYVRDKDRGFPWSVGGSDVGSLLGLENEPATGKLAMHWFGNKSQVLYSQINNKTQTMVTVNDSVAQEFRLYIDGILRWTVDTSSLTPTTNALKFVRNARHATMTDNDVYTQGGWIEHIHTRVANYAFNENDAYAEYRNPNKTPSIQFMGDSVLAWSTTANYYTQVTNNLFTNGVALNFMRDAVGGSTLYESAPSDMTYKVSDGGYVPDINSRPVGTVSGRPIDELYAKKKFDACFLGYTGNYTEGAHNYIYGENGYNDQGYGEYVRAIQTGFKAFCDTNNIVFFFNSPQPLGNDTFASGTSTRRTDIHYATMQQLVTLCGDDCLDTFATLATGDNKMPPEYTVDNTHLTDLGNDQLVEPIYNRLYQYYKTAHPEVTKTNYTDGIVPASTPMPVTIEYDLDYGVVEARTQDFTLTAGENIITIFGVTPQGVAYSQDCPIYYGDLVSDPVSKWEMDAITNSLIEDSVGSNDISVFGTETITDGYWTLNYLNGDYGRVFGSNATMFPRDGSPFSYAVWVKPTVALFTAYVAGMIGATTPGWHAFGIQSSLKLERASITNFLVTHGIPALNLNAWNHVAWVTDGTNDNLWINGVKSATGTLNNPVTALDLLIGCKWNSDDPDLGDPTQNFTGSMKKAWYFDRALIDVEVEYLNDNEL